MRLWYGNGASAHHGGGDGFHGRRERYCAKFFKKPGMDFGKPDLSTIGNAEQVRSR
jgi:hypothetical protein